MHVDAILYLTSSASGQFFYKSVSHFWEEAISIFKTSSKVTGLEVDFLKNSAEYEIG